MRYLIIMMMLGALTFGRNLQAQVAVVNAASFRNQPVAPGSWVSAFGTFPSVNQVLNQTLPIPKTLGGVTITVDGVAAPINFVSAVQINFIIPYGTTSGLKTVVLTGPAGTVNGTVQVLSAGGPGVFPLNATTPPQGAILNQDSSVNAQNRPAIRSQVIQIFATGHSTLSGPIGDGAAAPIPALTTQTLPQVLIGGVDCPVEFSGLAPNFAALWQINCRIPNLSFLSGKLPLQVFMNGVDSNEVSLYVQ